MPFPIRTAVASDLAELQGVFERASLSNEGDRDYLLANPGALVLSEDRLQQERTRAALGPQGTIIGFATSLVAGDTMELEDLFVDPPWMRCGVGRELVLDVLAIAHQRSFDRLHVTANPHAALFYGNMGFVTDEIVATQFYPAARMSRMVTAPDSAGGRGNGPP